MSAKKIQKNLSESIKKLSGAAEQISKMAELTEATQKYLEQLSGMSENMERFSHVTNSLTNVSDTLLNSYKSITDNSDGINQNSRGYVQQMEMLNRNISGLNTIYEIQLKSISSQIESIEHINGGLNRIREMYDGSVTDSSVFRNETEKDDPPAGRTEPGIQPFATGNERSIWVRQPLTSSLPPSRNSPITSNSSLTISSPTSNNRTATSSRLRIQTIRTAIRQIINKRN